MSNIQSFFATTAKGMEALLASELRELGCQDVSEKKAGAAFRGTLETAYRACLWSRVANRILMPLKTFPAPTPEKLYGGVKSIRWTDHIRPDGTLAIDFATSHSQITHSQYGTLKTKDAIVDQLRSVTGTRPSIDLSRPDLRVNVYLNNDEASVSLDLSGESLHMRGYRERGTPAPLKENLAAAILLFCDWPKIAAQGGAFIDPMCGSGTLPIEAAMIAARIAPGRSREHWGFQGWKQHEPKVWERLLAESQELEIQDPKRLPRIVGYDADFRAVGVAHRNLDAAKLRTRVHIEKRPLSLCERIGETGLVGGNPPYGERLGEEKELEPLYKLIGDTFKQKFQGWNGFVFTGSAPLSKVIGLRPSRKHPLFNGAIECRLLRYELYAGAKARDRT